MATQNVNVTIAGQTYNVACSIGGGVPNPTGWFSVKAYGAVGDNSANDTTAVQAAINAALAAGGGFVYFPAGLYKIAGGLTADFSSGSATQITLVGTGKHTSRLLLAASGTENLLEIDGWNTAARSFYIAHLGFSLSSGTGSNGISIVNCSRGEINNCYIYGFAAGAGVKIDAESNKNSDFNKVVSTYIGSCQDGIWLDCSGSSASYCDAHMISDCSIVTNSQYDIRCTNTGGLAGKANGHFIDNSWIQCGATGVHGLFVDDGVSAIKCSNTNFDGQPATTCITIGATSTYNLFTGCAIDGGFADNSGTAQIVNCHFTASGQTDIRDQVASYGLIPSAEPAAPVEGMIYYDSAVNKLKVYTGAVWETVTSA